ncbi:MAG: hypothetical protein PHQ81_01630, partial [Methanofollis sp.]|nr:hypothetical protein [Methanofollis sp.]
DGAQSSANLHRRGVRGAASPPGEERAYKFRKDALQFGEIFIPREFWDMLRMKISCHMVSLFQD